MIFLTSHKRVPHCWFAHTHCRFVTTAYMISNPEFELRNVVANRQSSNKDMICFMYHFAPAIVGCVRWSNGKTIDNFSNLLTISDEVTLAIVLENNWEKWSYLIKHKVSTTVFSHNKHEFCSCDI